MLREKELILLENLKKENARKTEEIRQLRKNQLIGQASGEESITITDGAFAFANILEETEIEVEGEKKKAYVVKLPQGLSKQQKRTGYNLLNLENEGKEITLDYTSEYSIKYENCKVEQTLKAGTYTLALKVKSLANGSINAVSLKNVDTTVATFSGYTTTTTTEKFFIKTITVDTDVTFNRISLQNAQIGTYIIKEIIILEGTYTAENLPECEEYGSSPSIDFPSEIENVRAWNLVDFSKPINKTPNTTYSFENDILKVVANSGTYTSIGWNMLDFFKKNSGKKIYFKYKSVDFSQANNPFVQIVTIINGVTNYNALWTTTRETSYTIPDDVSQLTEATFLVYPNNSSTDIEATIIFTEPMLVLEKDINKPYAPYGVIPISMGNKNSLDVTKLSDEAKKVGINYDNSFNIISTNPTADSRYWKYSLSNWFLTLKKGNYTILLFVLKKPTNENSLLRVFNQEIQILDSGKFINNNKNIIALNIRLVKDINNIGIELKVFDGIFKIMLLEGTYTEENLPMDYIEYMEEKYNLKLGNIKLNGKNDARDSLVIELEDENISDKKIKKLYLKKFYDKIDKFTGLIKDFTSSGSNERASLTIDSNFKFSHLYENPGLSNILKPINNGQTYLKVEGFTVNVSDTYSTLYMYIDEYKSLTAEEYIEKLNELGAYFILPLQNPELIDITDNVELVKDLEYLINNLKTFEEVTHIELQNGYIDLEYIKSTELAVNNLQKQN